MNRPATSLANQIYGLLLDLLRTGEIRAHHRLVDTDLALEHGISRMPVREALLRLTNEGHLVSTARGFAVPALSLQEISDLCEVRRQIEPRAAASAARDMTEACYSALTEAIETVRAAHGRNDLKELIRANIAFRNAWLGAVANRRLADTIAHFMDLFQSIRMGTFHDARHRLTFIEGLEGLYDAFAKRDPLLAGDRMASFMFNAEAAFLAVRRTQLAEEAAGAAGGGRRARARPRTHLERRSA